MKNRVYLLFLAAALLIVPSALAQGDHDRPDRTPSASPAPSVSAEDRSDNQKIANPLGLGGKDGQHFADRYNEQTEVLDSQRNSGGDPHEKPEGKSDTKADTGSSDKHQMHERTEHPDHN